MATGHFLAQAAQGNGSSDVWVPLLSALLGAVVGGAATLAGSVLVSRWELQRRARLRLYEELLPRVKNETWPQFRRRDGGHEELEQSLDALERTAVIAGPREWWYAVAAKVHGVWDAFTRFVPPASPRTISRS